MNEKLLQKINSELAGLHRNTATLEKIIRTQGTSTELDYKVSRNDLETFVWQKVKGIANGKETNLDLQSLSPYFFFPSEIKDLENLSHLNLKENSLSTLPPEVLTLTNLTSLNLANNHIQSLPNEFKNLGNLERLDLSFENPISRPNPTHEDGQLSHKLRVPRTVIRGNLDLMQRFPDDIESITECVDSIKNERELYKQHHLPNNLFEKLPSQITKLSKLTYLNISNVMLMDLTPEIGNLQNLEHLDVNYNFLQLLPPEIRQLKKLRFLDLRGNNLPIPSEILDKVDQPQTILNYYFSLSVYREIDGNYLYAYDNASPLNQVKLIVIGQGSNGKTSLVRRIISDTFDQRQSKTDGIEINRWYIHRKRNTIPPFIIWDDKRGDNPDSKIQINTWDFGGQEIMHATHQFFLTKRSLYLLVLDSRLTQEENRVEYWLKIIQSFGGESPVLIVGNKIDQHPLDIDRTGLQKKYPNIVGILETSAATGTGIEELKTAIADQVNNLPHVRDLLPETWFTVKTKLEELGRQSNFITQEKYLDLCTENEVSDETSQRTLIGFLHDLGVVLHFQDDPRLEALGILNPQWVTNGVYKILNSHTLFQNKGVLTTSMLDEILNLPEYPRGKRLFIVDMMKKFELCYDIEPDKTFLVPDLLPKDQPDLNFNGVPAFEYAYPVLPSSVITRFIVRLNQKIDDGFVWRTGVVLKIGGNKALVKADIEDRKITIAIDGMEHTRRETLTAIFYHLNDIHDSIKGLNPEKLVPVPGAENAKPISYNYLLMLEAKGIEILPVPDGNRLIDVNIRKVLSGVPNETQDKNREGVSNVTNIIVGGNFEGNLMVGDKNQVIQNSYNKIKSADISPELKETMKQLAEAVDAMLQKLPTEQAAEVAEDYGKLAEEAVKPKPNQKWYSVSIDGLIKAAENLDKLGTPVISLSRKVLSLLTGGVVK